jgi:hypothetical protein
MLAGAGNRGDRQAGAVDQRGALQPALRPVHRALAGALPTAGRLGEASVDRDVGQIQADQPFVGGQHRGAQGVEDSSGDPLIAPAAQRGGRARRIAQPFVAAAEDQRGDDLVEHDAVVDAPPVTTQRMPVHARRK